MPKTRINKIRLMQWNTTGSENEIRLHAGKDESYKHNVEQKSAHKIYILYNCIYIKFKIR